MLGEYYGNSHILKNEEPLKIGFIGYQKPLKGWSQFKKTAERVKKLSLHECLYQFGWGTDKLTNVEQINVDFKKNITAMTDSLRKKDIHVAVIWSTCPETYSYTYYEALAANCFVVTNKISGNVCSQVQNRRNGIVIDELSEIICNENKLRKLVNEFRTNGHITPAILKENERFLSLIPNTFWKSPKVKNTFDLSLILSIVIKEKEKIKFFVKKF